MVSRRSATGQRAQVVPLPGRSAISSAVSHGSAAFDIALPRVESRGTGRNHTIVISFNNEVVNGSASVSSGAGSVSLNPTFSGNTTTVNLNGVADAQNLTLNLRGVTDSLGQYRGQPTSRRPP